MYHGKNSVTDLVLVVCRHPSLAQRYNACVNDTRHVFVPNNNIDYIHWFLSHKTVQK